MYDNGWGVPENDKTAVKRYRLAAVQKDACAQINLGVMYRLGKSVTQNYVYDHIWWRLAVDNGDKHERKVQSFFAKHTTPSQLEKV